ncbi:MAG: photosynthetic reaction center cytochrome c subunit [Betaproteobacteria bacterium]|jgi:photosynthetic reaction center cytochrome c subunit|nr:photosynthetic reaction center cytochrome c subunit [Betaproteobacteria bacterium]
MRVLIAIMAAMAVLSGCERPPMDAVQHGYRGTGMAQIYNPRTTELVAAKQEVPVAIPSPGSEGPRASQVFKNVQVLGDISAGEFTRLMVSITAWVAPDQGCVYCHNPANFAEDTVYTKVVARRMLQMTRDINSQWTQHVAQTGVTCYTCHRGQPIPSAVWFKKKDAPYGANFMGDKAGQNTPDPTVNLSSLPYDPFTPFLLGNENIRVNATTALPTGNRQSIKQAEWTYGLMVHLSQALGVNCTYCHNTRSFQSWEGNPPQRVKAWHGIRMARSLNNDYMEPLTATFPDHRKGDLGDVAKINCETCHQGAYKPLYGASMLKDFPELKEVRPAPTQVAKK